MARKTLSTGPTGLNRNSQHFVRYGRQKLGCFNVELQDAVAAFLVRARARFSDNAPRDPRRFDAVTRLEAAGKAIGAELRRRAFD